MDRQKRDGRAAARAHRRDLAKGDPVGLPLVMSSTYHLPGETAGFRGYGRSANPTWEATEAALAYLEDAPTLAFPSGMAAITAALMPLLKAGGRLLVPSDGYYTVRNLAGRFLQPFGVIVEQRPTSAFLDGGVEGFDVVYAETPSNPGLDIVDLAAPAGSTKAAGATLIVDNTTMTPLGQRPLDLGADIVVSADTKAIGGHSDVLFGHVASRDEARIAAIRDWRTVSGSIPGPFEAWQVHRSLETLELRYERMCATAGYLAERLAGHRAVHAVRYPGLPGDPSHNLAKAQMQSFGFLIGFVLPSREQAERFIDACALLQPATSFGSTHSAAECRIRWGDAVEPGFVRLAVGCEPADELWRAIADSLDRVAI